VRASCSSSWEKSSYEDEVSPSLREIKSSQNRDWQREEGSRGNVAQMEHLKELIIEWSKEMIHQIIIIIVDDGEVFVL
jgi:hypothetical protein